MAAGINGIGGRGPEPRPGGAIGGRRSPARVVTNAEGDRLELSAAALRRRPTVNPDGLLGVNRVRVQRQAGRQQARVRNALSSARRDIVKPRGSSGTTIQNTVRPVGRASEARQGARAARESRQAPKQDPLPSVGNLPPSGPSIDLLA